MSTNEIRTRVEAFAADLTALIHKAALDAVNEALGAAPAGRAPRGSGKVAAVARAAKARPRRPGEKRDPKVLAALVERLHGYIKAHPGQRIEQIGVGLGIATKELTLPAKKLLAAKRITSKGEKRATTYAPSSAANGVVAAAKKRKKNGDAKGDTAKG